MAHLNIALETLPLYNTVIMHVSDCSVQCAIGAGDPKIEGCNLTGVPIVRGVYMYSHSIQV